MEVAPGTDELIARALNDMRLGLPIIISKGHAGISSLAVESAKVERLKRHLTAQAPAILSLSSRRATTLKARSYDGDIARIRVPAGSPPEWIQAVADPSRDMEYPMKGPFKEEREDSADLHRAAVSLARKARLLPAVLSHPVENASQFAVRNKLTCLDFHSIQPGAGRFRPPLRVTGAQLPIAVSEQARIHVFRTEDSSEEHCAVEVGNVVRNATVLTRLHSACFTGDVLGSLKCDCGPQLRSALERIAEADGGVLLYLNQEGRGIGLVNKVRAYVLQDQGFDTVDANHRLGFEDDERDFRTGAEILKSLGYSAVRLLTNNPSKVQMMEANGIRVVERVPLISGKTAFNKGYLSTKARKSGHKL